MKFPFMSETVTCTALKGFLNAQLHSQLIGRDWEILVCKTWQSNDPLGKKQFSSYSNRSCGDVFLQRNMDTEHNTHCSGFSVKQKCCRGHQGSLLGSCSLTLLILLPMRKYGRWPNTGTYYWWSQWEGSVSKPLSKSLWKHTHTNQPLPACQGSSLHRAFGEISFSSAFLFFFQPQPVRRLGFDMLSLISSLIWMTCGFMSCCRVDANQAGRRKFQGLRRFPTEQKGNH